MTHKDKTKEEFIEEVRLLQKRVAELEKLESVCKQQHQQDLSRLAAVVSHSNDAIIVQDIDGRITFWNRGAQMMYGYSEKEALGMSIDHITPPGKVAEHKKFVGRLVAGETLTSFETQRVTKNGSILDVWLTVTKLEEDQADSIISTGRDITKSVNLAFIERNITERKQAEEALVKSENRYRTLFENSHDAIMTLESPTWKFTSGNLAMVKMFMAKDKAFFNSHDPWSLSPERQPDGRPSVEKALEMIEIGVRDGSNFFEWTHKRLNGEEFLATVQLNKIVLVGKTILQATIIDITERKQAEEALRASEKRYVTLFEQSNDAIFIADSETRILVDCNKAALKMTGYAKEELLSMRADQLHPKDMVDETMEAFNSHASGKYFIADSVLLTRAGQRVNVSINTAVVELQGKTYLMGVFRDVSEQKTIENNIRASKEYLNSVINVIADPVFVKDVQHRFILLNDAFCVMTGSAREEIIGKTDYDFFPKEQVEVFLEKDGELLSTGKENTNEEEVTEASGNKKTIVTKKTLYVDGSGNRFIVGIIRDVTERKNMEESLRRSEERYRSIVDNIGIGVALIGPDMEIMSLNNQMKKWNPHIDFKDKHICYRAFNNPPGEGICSYCPTAKTLKDGLVHEDTTETPMGGQVFNYRIISSPIKGANGEVVAAIEMVEDITERKKMEKEAQKRLQELEVFYKASVGREERILELKKEIEQLKKEQGK